MSTTPRHHDNRPWWPTTAQIRNRRWHPPGPGDTPITMIFDNILSGPTTPLNCTTTRSIYCHLFASFSALFTPNVGLVTTLVIILAAQYVRSPWRRVPPGPKGFPILGNAFQLSNKRWMFQKECKRDFGMSIYHFVNTAALYVYQIKSQNK